MTQRRISIRFHTIDVDPRERFFEVLDNVQAAPLVNCLLNIGDHKHSLIVHNEDGGIFFSFAKEQKSNWPYKLKTDGNIEKIPLGDDGLLGEVTYFKIMRETGILLELYNHRGPSPTDLAEYFMNWSKNEHSKAIVLHFRTVVNRESYESFLRLRDSRRANIRLQVASPGTRFIDDTLGDSNIETSLDFLSEIGAISVNFTISMYRSSRSFEMPRFRNVIDFFLKNSTTERLEVTGHMPGSEVSETIDLLGSRRLAYEVSIPSTDSYVSVTDVLNTMKNALSHYQDLLANFEWQDNE